MTRIVIADGHPVTLAGLGEVLAQEQDMAIVGEASNGMDALLQVSSQAPDVLLMDIDLPLRNGLAVLREMNDRHLQPSVLLFVENANGDELLRAMQMGCAGIIVKGAQPSDLIESIRMVRERANWTGAPAGDSTGRQ